jgi:hypothetical protein
MDLVETIAVFVARIFPSTMANALVYIPPSG